MSIPSKQRWLAVAFVFAFLVVGAAYWPIPYDKVSLPNSLMGPGLFLVGLAAVAARVFGRAGFLATTAVVGSAVAVAILARVIVDTTSDPTSHNLWPLEVILAGVVGYACSATGALAATLWTAVSKRR